MGREDPLQQVIKARGIFRGPGVVAVGGVDGGVGQGSKLLYPFGQRQVVVTGGDDGHRLPDGAKPGAYRPAG